MGDRYAPRSGEYMRALAILAFLATCLLSAVAVAQDATQWPHAISGPNGSSAVVYQPQAVSWPEHEYFTARAAVAITPHGAKAPIFGTIELTFATSTDLATNTVTLTEPKLVETHFPSLDTQRAAQIETGIKQVLATLPEKHVALNSILLGLDAPPQATAPVAVVNDPPVIFHSARPASLVVFDGEPVMVPAGESGLTYAVNTNWNVFFDPAGTGTWYLLNNGLWLAAPAATGAYKPVTKLPPAFAKLPADANFADVRKAVPPKAANPSQAPTIFVSTKPAEIIVTAGPISSSPSRARTCNMSEILAPICSSTPPTATFTTWCPADGSAPSAWMGRGPMRPTRFPDFARIPPNGPHGAAVASVPGTVDAELAVLKAQIPQQGTLKRSATLTVTYAGKPEFRPIPGTPMTYAVNTSFEVIGVEGRYYACYQGAWFVSTAPAGPWALAESVPKVIYTIPPNSPLYNVTYVTVVGSTPEAVTYAFTSGYTLSYVSAGVVVYGTGYYYPPYIVPGAVPIYYSYPYTYAGSVWYNPTTGVWARGGSVYGPPATAPPPAPRTDPPPARGRTVPRCTDRAGGADAWSAYNPTTGAYAHGSATWGPNGGTSYASFNNPTTGRSGSTTQNWNGYSRWGSSTISGPNQTVNTASGSNARGTAGGFSSSSGAAAAGVHTSSGNNAAVGRGANGDIYAGANGNAYKHNDDGWSKWDNGSWQPVTPPQKPGAGSKGAGSNSLGSSANNNAWQKNWQSRMSGSNAPGAAEQRPDAAAGSGPLGAFRGQPGFPRGGPEAAAARDASAASQRQPRTDTEKAERDGVSLQFGCVPDVHRLRCDLRPAAAAAAPPPAATAPPRAMTQREEAMLLRRSYSGDFRAHCSGVQPGGGRAVACLMQNQARLSPPSKTALAEHQ